MVNLFNVQRIRYFLSLSLLVLLVACGGSEGPEIRSSSGHRDVASATKAQTSGTLSASAAASAGVISVRAGANLAGNLGPVMAVRVNGVVVGSTEVRSDTFQDYSFNAGPIPAGATIDVVFTNDAVVNGEDRNLYVDSINVDGTVLSSSAPEVKFDRGVADAAFDGIDVLPGLSTLYWSGALRFTLTAPQPNTGISVRASANLAGNVGPLMEVRVNGVVVGSSEVRSDSYQNYDFSAVNVPAGAAIDVVFTNDAFVSGEDRNLYVASITVGGVTTPANAPGVTFDRGFGAAAFDGVDVLPGLSTIYWSGALRFPGNSTGNPLAGYTVCALEGQVCNFTGSADVVYGALGTYTAPQRFSSSVACNNTVFGDPLVGTVKSCYFKPAGGTGTNQAPVAVIASPLSGATFKAGDTITFAGSGTDAEDGVLAASQLTWWAELHHDTHTHPFQPFTVGGSGSVSIPTSGETSDNIFYRFHLRATDSAGLTHEVTRDIVPLKSVLTLQTSPPGLSLTLDGQPITAPFTFTGVVGIERALGAAAQNANGRRYVFAGWSDGGAATHTIATPSTNTTYTATFTDTGPVVNNPPVVALVSAPSTGTLGTPITLNATATDTDDSVSKVEFFDGATKIGEDLSSPFSISWTPAAVGARNITARATDNYGLAATSAAVVVTINPSAVDTQPPVAQLTSPAAFATGLTGTIAVTATATDNVGVTGIEIQVDGVQVGSVSSGGSNTVNVDTNAYASGQHVLRARARDAAGNLSAWASATVQFGGSRPVPAGFTRNEGWITGLNSATAFAQTPDGRLLVAEQGGALRVIKAGALLAAPMVSVPVDSSGERGLIGVTLHPNFASNGFVYIYHTTTEGGTHNRISRFVASGDVAAAAPTPLIDLQPLSGATNHNGGAMHFGIDGKLYVAVGDNANSALAPRLDSVFGKMLRFNDDGTIPSDNPFFATQTGQARSIWAYGLRNPFTFAVQPGTGRIHINDVGQNTWEEINLGVPGANYGWPSSEGPTNVVAGVTGPLFTYKHSAASPAGSGPGGFFVGFAIAGGTFYPDTGPFPDGYRGSYYFADFVSRFVGRYDALNNASYAFANVAGSPVDLLSGTDGALYVLTRGGVTRISVP
jgi:glucose/arabinose dehydrogenase